MAAGDFDYDAGGGVGYAARRRTDPRIAAHVRAFGAHAHGLERLAEDPASGAWDARHGHQRTRAAFDGSLSPRRDLNR